MPQLSSTVFSIKGYPFFNNSLNNLSKLSPLQKKVALASFIILTVDFARACYQYKCFSNSNTVLKAQIQQYTKKLSQDISELSETLINGSFFQRSFPDNINSKSLPINPYGAPESFYDMNLPDLRVPFIFSYFTYQQAKASLKKFEHVKANLQAKAQAFEIAKQSLKNIEEYSVKFIEEYSVKFLNQEEALLDILAGPNKQKYYQAVQIHKDQKAELIAFYKAIFFDLEKINQACMQLKDKDDPSNAKLKNNQDLKKLSCLLQEFLPPDKTSINTPLALSIAATKKLVAIPGWESKNDEELYHALLERAKEKLKPDSPSSQALELQIAEHIFHIIESQKDKPLLYLLMQKSVSLPGYSLPLTDSALTYIFKLSIDKNSDTLLEDFLLQNPKLDEARVREAIRESKNLYPFVLQKIQDFAYSTSDINHILELMFIQAKEDFLNKVFLEEVLDDAYAKLPSLKKYTPPPMPIHLSDQEGSYSIAQLRADAETIYEEIKALYQKEKGEDLFLSLDEESKERLLCTLQNYIVSYLKKKSFSFDYLIQALSSLLPEAHYCYQQQEADQAKAFNIKNVRLFLSNNNRAIRNKIFNLSLHTLLNNLYTYFIPKKKRPHALLRHEGIRKLQLQNLSPILYSSAPWLSQAISDAFDNVLNKSKTATQK